MKPSQRIASPVPLLSLLLVALLALPSIASASATAKLSAYVATIVESLVAHISGSDDAVATEDAGLDIEPNG